ncbi:hypothetical protein BLOT_003009 [Blomia tropicalis]|nr:hypothetical protein BLOT_003009 [Blomia tropicalis]
MAKRYTANKIQKRERECLHVDVDVDDENEIDYEHFGKVAIMAIGRISLHLQLIGLIKLKKNPE